MLEGWKDPAARERFITVSDAAWRSRDTPDYVDIVDLCERLRRKKVSQGVARAAAVTATAARKVIIASGYRSRAPERPRGLSVYLPRSEFQVEYKRLRFARDTRWPDLAKAVVAAGSS